jgi:Concanavalin A-like lectin/glucanases superfamily
VGSPGWLSLLAALTATTTNWVDNGTGASLSFDQANAFSLLAWVTAFCTTCGAQTYILSKLQSSGQQPGYGFGFCGNTKANCTPQSIFAVLENRKNVANELEVFVAAGGTTISDGGWHLVAMTYDGSSTLGGASFIY